MLGRYEILSRPKEGGMGLVHRARDPRLVRDVAVKTPKEEAARSPLRIERFL
jgi:hypothetical protein